MYLGLETCRVSSPHSCGCSLHPFDPRPRRTICRSKNGPPMLWQMNIILKININVSKTNSRIIKKHTLGPNDNVMHRLGRLVCPTSVFPLDVVPVGCSLLKTDLEKTYKTLDE
jgi:hypothetical protein